MELLQSVLITVLVEPSLGSSTGLAFYSLELVAAVHAILLLFKPEWNGLVCHPHVSLSRAYVGEMFIEIMRASKLSLASYSIWTTPVASSFCRDTCIHSTTSLLLDGDIGHLSSSTHFQYITQPFLYIRH